MNKNICLNICLLFCILLILSGCSKEIDEEEVKLYPIYELEENVKKWGFMDQKGKVKIKPKYDTVNEFRDGLSVVSLDGFFGVINKNGIEILKPEFINIGSIKDGYFSAKRDSKVGLYHKKGPINLTKDYLSIGNHSNGYFIVTEDSNKGTKFGYINNDGREMIKPKYDMGYSFHRGKAIVKQDNSFKIIDKKGKVAQVLEYKEVKESDEVGKYIVSKNGYDYGLINQDGNEIIPLKYSSILEVKNEDLVVTKEIKGKNKKGLINMEDNIVMDFIYDDIYFLNDNYLAATTRKGDFGLPVYNIFKLNGKKISKREYYNIGGENSYDQEYISVSTGYETYLINEKGNILKEYPIVVGMGEMFKDDSLIKTIVDENLIYYNMDGEIVWEPDKRFYIGKNIQILEKCYNEPGIEIKYPYIIGFENRELQNELNDKLKSYFLSDDRGNESEFSKYRYYKVNYNLFIKNNILSVEKNLDALRKEKSKEISLKNIYNINIYNGNEYRLKDIVGENKINYLNEYIDINVNGIKTGKKYLDGNNYFFINDGRIYIVLEKFYNTDDFLSDREVSFSINELREFININSELI